MIGSKNWIVEPAFRVFNNLLGGFCVAKALTEGEGSRHGALPVKLRLSICFRFLVPEISI